MRLQKRNVLQMLHQNKQNERRLLQALKDFKALTKNEAARLLYVPPWQMQNTIYLLQTRDLIGKVDVWRNRKDAKYKLFPYYAGKRLYFIDKERLKEWVTMQVPPTEKTSKRFQRILKNRVKKNFGIKL